jgi:hypothetical protein
MSSDKDILTVLYEGFTRFKETRGHHRYLSQKTFDLICEYLVLINEEAKKIG